MRKLFFGATAVFLIAGLAVSEATAGFVSVANPGGTTSEIGARIRWGASGFEASLYDANPFGQTPTLNPPGSPVWQLGEAYKFEVTFDSITGELGLKVDFNRDNSFGTGEQIFRTTFSSPGPTSYQGLTFEYLSISGNESGSTGRSIVNNLTINGTSFGSIEPNGGFSETFFLNQNLAGTSIKIAGDITFTTTGTAQERPSWDFRFRNSTPVVPEPNSLAIFGLGALLMASRRRR